MLMFKRFAILILAGMAALPVARGEIKRIDIIHLSHTDVGFTDHPEVTREMQKKYIDIALDACARKPRVSVDDRIAAGGRRLVAGRSRPRGGSNCWPPLMPVRLPSPRSPSTIPLTWIVTNGARCSTGFPMICGAGSIRVLPSRMT